MPRWKPSWRLPGALFILVGCDPTAPVDVPELADLTPLVGSHLLRAVNGRAVPYSQPGFILTGVHGGMLEIRADSSFTLWFSNVHETFCVTSVNDGRLTLTSDSIVFTTMRSGSAQQICGVVVGETMLQPLATPLIMRASYDTSVITVAMTATQIAEFRNGRVAALAGAYSVMRLFGSSLPVLLMDCQGQDIWIVAGSLDIRSDGRFVQGQQLAGGCGANGVVSLDSGRISRAGSAITLMPFRTFGPNARPPSSGTVCGVDVIVGGHCGAPSTMYRRVP